MSTLPLGCLPGARTIGGGLLRDCVELINQEAQLFNSKLSSQLDSIKNDFPDANLAFVDVYSSLLDLVQDPQKYGNIYVVLFNIYTYMINKKRNIYIYDDLNILCIN